MRTTLAALLAAGLLLSSAAPGHAAPAGEVTDPGERLDLSIRARGLGITPMTPTAETLGLESAKAPTGAGSVRMPSATTEIAPGVYLSVEPACLPGEEPWRRRAVPPPVRRR